jgi:large subunit ribosomal protein L23
MIRIHPHVTEKAYQAAQGEQPVYTFRIPAHSTKQLVAAAVATTYNVEVVAIRLVHLPSKVRRFKGIKGSTQEVHKAVVQLAPGQRIAAFEPQQASDSQE